MSTRRDRAGLPIVEKGPANPRGAADPRNLPDAQGAAVRRDFDAEGVPGTSLRDLDEGDLHELLTAFYDTVENEPLLAPYFAVVDMDAHMPRIVDFWSTLLWHTGRYSGNAFRPHMEMAGLTGEHFARWLATLERTIDARFAGSAAEQMKALGHRIAYSMQVRLGITPFEEYRPV